jgi:hypothetical protein
VRALVAAVRIRVVVVIVFARVVVGIERRAS